MAAIVAAAVGAVASAGAVEPESSLVQQLLRDAIAPRQPTAQENLLAAVPDQAAIHRLDDGEAWRLLEKQFPAQASGPLHDPAEGRIVERYVNDYVARVLERGGRKLLLSTVPLRALDDAGALAPTRLGLADEGTERVPANAPFELRLAENHPGRLTLGPTAGSAVTVRPLESDESARLQTPGDRLFWANTNVATDTLVTPTSSGAETFEQLRGPDAPERFGYAIDLPAGARLELTPEGGAQVVRGEETLMRVAPPQAHDAAGTSVPARLEQTADGLVLHVEHSRPEVPIPCSPTRNGSPATSSPPAATALRAGARRAPPMTRPLPLMTTPGTTSSAATLPATPDTRRHPGCG